MKVGSNEFGGLGVAVAVGSIGDSVIGSVVATGEGGETGGLVIGVVVEIGATVTGEGIETGDSVIGAGVEGELVP